MKVVDRPIVCGLEVPAEVVLFAARREWTSWSDEPRLDPAVVERVFGERPDSSWRFYTIDEMRGMTEDWHRESDPAWFGAPPDDIEARRSVLVGEIGYDRPFALDLRDGAAIRLLTTGGHRRLVAETFSALLVARGIDEPT